MPWSTTTAHRNGGEAVVSLTEAQQSRIATVACPFCATLNRVDLARLADRPKCGSCGRPILLDRPVAATDATMEGGLGGTDVRSEEHTSELQSQSNLVCRLLLGKKKNNTSSARA